jgi:pimeloyl-ACP methyl ester carboxylesterase
MASAGGSDVPAAAADPLARLLEGIPVTERRLGLAGVSTSVLEGGEGPPIVLLHGQGGFAAHWGRVIPRLVETHRVVAPDLPGLGRSEVRSGRLDEPGLVAWLGDLIAHTCAESPAVVGISLGGALAARFAVQGWGSGPPGRPGQFGRARSSATGTGCAGGAGPVQHAANLGQLRPGHPLRGGRS